MAGRGKSRNPRPTSWMGPLETLPGQGATPAKEQPPIFLPLEACRPHRSFCWPRAPSAFRSAPHAAFCHRLGDAVQDIGAPGRNRESPGFAASKVRHSRRHVSSKKTSSALRSIPTARSVRVSAPALPISMIITGSGEEPAGVSAISRSSSGVGRPAIGVTERQFGEPLPKAALLAPRVHRDVHRRGAKCGRPPPSA